MQTPFVCASASATHRSGRVYVRRVLFSIVVETTPRKAADNASPRSLDRSGCVLSLSDRCLFREQQIRYRNGDCIETPSEAAEVLEPHRKGMPTANDSVGHVLALCAEVEQAAEGDEQ